MSGKISEKILLYKIRVAQDPDAYALLYDKYVKQIYRFIYFKVSSHEEAEDITSDVFLKAWNYLQEKKEIKSFSGMLYKISRNCIVDLYRSRSLRPEATLGDELEISDNGKWLVAIGSQLETENVVKSLKKLKQEYQEVITFRYIDELELDEIGEIMNKGSVAVRVTLHRALKKLKKIVQENYT